MLPLLRCAIVGLLLLTSVACGQSTSQPRDAGPAQDASATAQACRDVSCACFNVGVAGTESWTAHVMGNNIDCVAQSATDPCLSRLAPGHYTAEFFVRDRQLDPSAVSIHEDDLPRLSSMGPGPTCCSCTDVYITVVGSSVDLPDGGHVAACHVSAAAFDQTCATDADCIPVASGDFCADDCEASCPQDFVSTKGRAGYDQAVARVPHRPDVGICHCPAEGFPVCSHGKCTSSLPKQ